MILLKTQSIENINTDKLIRSVEPKLPNTLISHRLSVFVVFTNPLSQSQYFLSMLDVQATQRKATHKYGHKTETFYMKNTWVHRSRLETMLHE